MYVEQKNGLYHSAEDEKKPLVSVEDIEGRIDEIDKEIDVVHEREYRDGYMPDMEHLAKLRNEKFSLQNVLDVLSAYALEDIQKELDERDPIKDTLGEEGLGSYSFYVLAHAEKVLQHQDKELQARVDLGERVIEQWEEAWGKLAFDKVQGVYKMIRDKDVPLDNLEERIRKRLILDSEVLQKELVDIGGHRCLKVAEWQDGVDSYVLGNAVNSGEFYYAEVNGDIRNSFEYDFKPSKEKVEDDWINLESEREINRQEELAGGFDMEKELYRGNPDFYKLFYAGQQDEEAYAFQKETGWHMIWGSDSQGLNGDTWVVYRNASDLPEWLREYAREEEQIPGHDEQQPVGIEVLFTFGTAKQFPFELGYVSITAPSVKIAIEEFRRNYPDVNDGVLNCSDYYYKEESVAEIKEHGNGAGCHRAIVVTSTDKSVDELIASSKAQAGEAKDSVIGRDLEI